MAKYTKKDKYTLEVESPKKIEALSDVETEKKEYDYKFLLEQRGNVTSQRDELIALKNAELKEVETLIAEAEKLGLIEK